MSFVRNRFPKRWALFRSCSTPRGRLDLIGNFCLVLAELQESLTKLQREMKTRAGHHLPFKLHVCHDPIYPQRSRLVGMRTSICHQGFQKLASR